LWLALPTACKPEVEPSSQDAAEQEFDRMLAKSVTPPRRGMHWVEWDLTSDDHRMLEAACASPARFDRLLDRVAGIPDPSFPGSFFWYSHEGMKDCPLGEEYVSLLAARLLKEERPKHRKAIRDSIQWHSFHEHTRKWTPIPYEKSAAAIIRGAARQDEEDDRWYGVVQANYGPRYPEAAAEMWRAIRAEAERQNGPLAVGAFETAFNGLHTASRYRDEFLNTCLQFIRDARDQAHPHAAGWMLKFQMIHLAPAGLLSREVFAWESALVETATRARSQAHRGEAIQVLHSMGSPRTLEILNKWLSQELPEAVIGPFVRDLRIPAAGVKDPFLEAKHPRVQARLSVGRGVLDRNWNGEPSAVTYLLSVLQTDPRTEMRQEALHQLAYTLRDDPRDARDDLPQGMSNTLDLVDIVSVDPSPAVRRVLAAAMQRYRHRFDDLPRERLPALNRLFDSVK